MFKTQLVVFSVLWLALASIYFYAFSYPSENDWLYYHQLMDSHPHAGKEKIEGQGLLVKQQREHTTKQIFYTKEAYRQQSRLSSKDSQLLVNKRTDGTVELIEYFNGLIFAGLQKGMGDDRSHMGYFKAKQAAYAYRTGQLEAEDVEAKHYVVPFFSWPDSFEEMPLFMQAHAQKLNITLFDGAWQATGFRAVFPSEEI